jgi:ribosomal protein L12E/L44/L45/RPP1/RPP2
MAKATTKAVDFSGVKDRGNFNTQQVESGDYLAKITKVEDSESKKDGEFQYVFTIKLSKFSQYSYPYYCKLSENQLWKLRNLLVAGGLNVPKSRTKVDPNRVVGKTIGVTMEDDEYEGKMKSVIAAVFPAAELAAEAGPAQDEPDEEEADEDEEEAVEEKPKKKKGKKGKKEKVEDLDLDDL